MSIPKTTGFTDSKSHYLILDGLRGVAAITVVLFHLLETFTNGNNHVQIINHGYLAVDFFFVLSGFVIGYAYDDRWNKMTLGSFFKRRLIRLHPMIIAGMITGAVTFYFQDSRFFPGIDEIPVWKMLVVMIIGFTLIPVTPRMDIRGWQEMHPLNGPAWSLFFEYVANILYALFIRKFSNRLLSILVFLAGAALIHLSVTRGDIIGGWSLEPLQLRIGFTRLLYPFFAGLLLSRLVKPGRIVSVPRMGGTGNSWINGLYISAVVIVIFPMIVYMGASGSITSRTGSVICRFLGDISYPVYIIHYPLIYMFMAWVDRNNATMAESVPMALLVLVSVIVTAYGLFRLYDVPVRKWLTGKLFPSIHG